MNVNELKEQGTKENQWLLKTSSGTSEYMMYRDETSDPLVLVCVVGKTVLHYVLRSIEDLHSMLKAHGDWMLLGSADEQKPLLREPLRHGGDRRRILSRGGMA